MVIGVDFDNTIVCYDQLFHRVAVERGLIPAELPARKNDVRNYLRAHAGDHVWTELQGCVYGPRMAEAQAFPGVVEFFSHAVRARAPLHIISHKTRKAVAGPAYDLQETALAWLHAQGFFDPARIGLSRANVHFGLTREEKIQHIRATGCTVFIDDLEETYLEKAFPANVKKILFGAGSAPAGLPDVQPFASWDQINRYVFPALQ